MFFPFPLLSTFQILCFLQDPAQGPPTPCCFPSLPPPLPLPSRGNEIAPFSRTVKTLYYQKLCGHVLSLLRDIKSSGENFSLCPLRPSLAISRHLVNLLNENTFVGCCSSEWYQPAWRGALVVLGQVREYLNHGGFWWGVTACHPLSSWLLIKERWSFFQSQQRWEHLIGQLPNNVRFTKFPFWNPETSLYQRK